MGITIKQELDPIYEVLGLLYLTNHRNWKEELKKELPSYGVEPEQFYEKHFKILEKYLKVFQRYKVTLPQEEKFFKNCSESLFYLYAAMGTEQRAYLVNPDLPLEKDKLRKILAYYLSSYAAEEIDTAQGQDPRFSLSDEAAVIRFVDQLESKPEDKWHFLELLFDPCHWYRQLFEMVQKNLPAYEKARTAVEKPLKKLLDRYTNIKDEDFLKIADAFTRDVTVYAALALPLMQFVLYTNGYQGVFCFDLSMNNRDPDAAFALLSRQMKALSDKSKFDILCELKHTSRYNLELAEQLQLSPSTTSHHMNTLLACGFVSVDKQDGKVYYSLNKKNLELLLRRLKELLL